MLFHWHTGFLLIPYSLLFRILHNGRIWLRKLLRTFIFTITLLKDGVIDLRLSHMHDSCRWATIVFSIRFLAISFKVIHSSIICLFVWVLMLGLWWRVKDRSLFLIWNLECITHNTLLSLSFWKLRCWCFTFIEAFATIFSHTLTWIRLHLRFVIFKIRKEHVFLQVINVQISQELL